MQSAFAGGDPAKIATRAPKPPPLPRDPTQQDGGAVSEAEPSALAEVFAGLLDGAPEETYGAAPAMAAPQAAPPRAHILNRMVTSLDPYHPTYRQQELEHSFGQGEGETDEKFRERVNKAASGYGDKINYLEEDAYKRERELSRKQRAVWNGLTSEDRASPIEDKKLAALKIGLNEGEMPLAYTTRVDDLESPAGRMETLNRLSQNMDPDDPHYQKTDEVSCAGATIVGGVLLAEGRKGLTKLYAAVQKPGEKDEKPEEKELREKLESGKELTIGDLQYLQHMVYGKLKDIEGVSEEELQKQITSKDPAEKAKAFANREAINEFMTKNKDIAQMFSQSNIDISAIDTDADAGNVANHVVLRINDKDGNPIAYYDPWKKKGDQGQIINALDGEIERRPGEMPPAALEDYKNAERGRGHFDLRDRDYMEKKLNQLGKKEGQWWTDEQQRRALNP